MKVIDKLKLARERIRLGWCQEEYWEWTGDVKTSYCLAGACVAGEYTVTVSPGVLRALGFATETDLFDWNDVPGRTQRAVVMRLSRAINKLEVGK